MKKVFLLLTTIIAILSLDAKAQFKDYGVKGGAKYEQLIPFSELNMGYSFLAKGYLCFELSNTIGLELNAGWGQYKTENNYSLQTNTYVDSDSLGEIETDIIPIDLRLKFTPWVKTAKTWNPYFYIGGGMMNFNIKQAPDTVANTPYSGISDGWAGVFPAGAGTEIRLGSSVLLDFNLGYTYTTTDQLNAFIVPSFSDGALNIGLGLTFGNFKPGSTDDDKDGLTNEYEQKTCTDYKNPDTDGDLLQDGAEVNQYTTNACNMDTDADKLSDGEEVLTYSTNPLMPDTDSDKLTDYDELKKYSTLPKDSDTDDDGLIDGDEVLTHKTDPKNPDTDAGSVNDGIEVGRGTNPLNPDDHLPKQEVKVAEVIHLEGINFATDSWQITSIAEEKLALALNTMKNNPSVEVEIIGHTDNTGGRAWNMELSERRAISVKEWFVSQGISGSRITTIGVGPDDPIAPNDTREGRFQNRRIDFKRIK